MTKTLMCPPELFEQDLSGRCIIVTGANSGIGLITARQLAKQGASVVMACRRVSEGETCAADIRKKYPSAKIEVRELDLGDLSSVRKFAKEFLVDHDTIHALLNNAGVMACPQGKTVDGFETQIGINHLGHFLLTELLLDAIKKGAPSRIVNVSSCFHDEAMGKEGKMDFDDLFFEKRKYDKWESYAQSKLANVLYAKGLAKRLEGTGVTAVSLHPGWVRTNLMRHTMSTSVQNFFLRPFLVAAGMIEPWEGAQTSLYSLLSPDVVNHSGEYYSQVGIYRDKSCAPGGWPLRSPNPHAHDDEAVEKLYEKSADLVGLA